MIKLIFSICLFLSGFAQAEQSYIKIGDAKSKKSNLGFPYFNNLGSIKTGAATASAADIYTIVKKDLELSTYFQIMSNPAFLEDPSKTSIKPLPKDPDGFKFEPLKKADMDFVIRTGYSIINSELIVEMFLYNVSKADLIVGKRYKSPVGIAKQIGHTMANDILEALTGVRGAFMSKLVTTSDRGGGQSKEVYIMTWDGYDIEKISNHRSSALSPNWSPDGKKVVYSVFTTFIRRGASPTTNVSLYTYDIASEKRTLTAYRPGVNSGATFSNDGKSIFLGMSMGSGAADIYHINLNGDIIKRLTTGPAGAINVEPSLNPEGTRIAFSSERGGRPMIYAMDTDGGNVKRLTFDGVYNSSPSWSPDGKKIAFAGQSENHFDIFVMNADGSNIVRITSAKKANGKFAHNEDPSFSPDSRYVVYSSNRTGKNQIYISTIDGSEERRVTNDSHNYYKPKWSRNIE
ncbi:MAG: translocation protein TolB [Pseudobdellovibrio sp.]